MEWSKVNTEYSIHRVRHTPSTAHTKYDIHHILYHPKIDFLPLPASLSALSRPCCTEFSTFPWLWVNQWIESRLPLHYPSNRPPPDRPPPSTPPISIDHGLQVHLQTCSIMASKCISEFNLISASTCISKLAQSRPPSASLSYTISASKCISKLTQSRPPSATLSSTWSRPPSASPLRLWCYRKTSGIIQDHSIIQIWIFNPKSWNIARNF